MIRLTNSLKKTVPHPVHQYGSISASASLEVELGNGTDPVAESDLLFRRLDAVLDQELKRQANASAVVPAVPAAASSAPAGPNQLATPARPAQPARPSARRPAPSSPSQLAFIDRLIRETGVDPNAILQEFAITALDQLSCKEAAGLIDDLKVRPKSGSR